MKIDILTPVYLHTLTVLLRECKWPIDKDSLYVDYIVWRQGDNETLSVGWQWELPKEGLTRCVKISGDKITDYYTSYEKFTFKLNGIFSHEVNPDTMERVCEYRYSGEGNMHKYAMDGTVMQTNLYHKNNADFSLVDVMPQNATQKFCEDDVMLVSKKSYGNISYLDVKRFKEPLSFAKKRIGW